MADFPSLPLFTDAIMADTSHLTDDEFGLYMRIMITMWRTPYCRIPNDREWLLKRFGNPGLGPLFNDFNRIEKTLNEFCACDGNFWTQKRLLKEYNYLKKQKEIQTKRSKEHWDRKRAEKTAQKKSVPAKPLKKANSDEAAGISPHPTPPTVRSYAVASAGDAGAAENVTAQVRRYVEVGKQIAAVTGWDRDPNWFGDYARVDVWLQSGWSPELDILPTVKRLIAGKARIPTTLKYFENAIADAYAYRTSPIPKSQNGENKNAQSAKPTKHERAQRAAAAAVAELDQQWEESQRAISGPDHAKL